MDVSHDRPQCKLSEPRWNEENKKLVVTDEEFNDQFYHQLEYFDWRLEKDDVVFTGCWQSKPVLMGLFYGQENKLKLIHDEFLQYLREVRSKVEACIVEAIAKMQQYEVPCKTLFLRPEWICLFSGRTFRHMHVTQGYANRIESDDMHGRFVSIEGL